jgi:acyl-CoA thioester hydrolase
MSGRFVHSIRPRYAEIDQQGVVFNAHWLTYFDDACTRWFEWIGDGEPPAWFKEFDVMLVKATIEWSGPAGFDEVVDIAVTVDRVGTSSFDLRYDASVGDRPVCTGVITYVSIRPGHHESTPIPDSLRTRITSASASET